MKTNKQIKYLTTAGFIAALYVVLTYIANAFGLASGAIQLRLSEALCILPYFTPAAIPGLALGCFLANILTGCCALDIIVGTFATLIGAYAAYQIRDLKFAIPVPTIIANALLVPVVLIYGYGIHANYFYLLATVGAGEILSAGVLGIFLLQVLSKIPKFKQMCN